MYTPVCTQPLQPVTLQAPYLVSTLHLPTEASLILFPESRSITCSPSSPTLKWASWAILYCPDVISVLTNPPVSESEGLWRRISSDFSLRDCEAICIGLAKTLSKQECKNPSNTTCFSVHVRLFFTARLGCKVIGDAPLCQCSPPFEHLVFQVMRAPFQAGCSRVQPKARNPWINEAMCVSHCAARPQAARQSMMPLLFLAKVDLVFHWIWHEPFCQIFKCTLWIYQIAIPDASVELWSRRKSLSIER